MSATKQLIGTLLGGDTVGTLSKTSGAKKSEVESLIGAALPLMVSSMQKSAGTKKGEASLEKALSDHAGDDVSDVKSFLKNVDAQDGAKILEHLFGDNTKKTVSSLSKKAGTTKSQTTAILVQLAPLLLSLLGQQNQGSSGGIGSILGALLGDSSDGDDSLLGALLGSGTSDAAGSLLGNLLGSNSSSGSSVAGTLISALLDDDDDDDDDDGGLLGNLLGGGSGLAGNLLGSLFGDDSQK